MREGECQNLEEALERLLKDDYTTESLGKLLDAGVDVGMVQIGNEINNGMSGETDVDAVMQLLNSGSKAVREVAESIGLDI